MVRKVLLEIELEIQQGDESVPGRGIFGVSVRSMTIHCQHRQLSKEGTWTLITNLWDVVFRHQLIVRLFLDGLAVVHGTIPPVEFLNTSSRLVAFATFHLLAKPAAGFSH